MGCNERQGDILKEEECMSRIKGAVCLWLPRGGMSVNLLTMFYYKGARVKVCQYANRTCRMRHPSSRRSSAGDLRRHEETWK